MKQTITTVVFDLGGVLIDWNPRYVYRDQFPDNAAVEQFLTDICSHDWNAQQDAGRPFTEAVQEIAARCPGYEGLAAQWLTRFDEMMAGPIAGTVDILARLRAQGTPVYALTNWSAETFPCALRRFEFLSWFDGIVMSGEEKIIKPDPRIYRLLLDRYRLTAHECFFTDDNAANITAAEGLGFAAHRFTSPEALAKSLHDAGVLPVPA